MTMILSVAQLQLSSKYRAHCLQLGYDSLRELRLFKHADQKPEWQVVEAYTESFTPANGIHVTGRLFIHDDLMSQKRESRSLLC